MGEFLLGTEGFFHVQTAFPIIKLDDDSKEVRKSLKDRGKEAGETGASLKFIEICQGEEAL